jgi:CBS domain-containing protein
MTDLIYNILPNPRRPIVYIKPDLKVSDCVKLMLDNDIGALVVHDGDRLIGMVSERDVVRNCVYLGLDPNLATAGEIAYAEVSVLPSNDAVEKAMETITRTKRRHLLVSENGELIALLSIGDVLYHVLEEKSRVIDHLETYITS